ncbi:MAG: hypothetical protein AAB468_01195 [Patescibacteria group bacterium]
MKKSTTIIILVAAFLVAILVFYEERLPEQVQQKWETKSDQRAGVTVAVTPIKLSSGSREWMFNVVMDTHSIELDQDMVSVTTLTDDRGAEHRPIRWEGAVGGHHRAGVLVFQSLDYSSNYLELKIKNVGAVSERLFKWELK